MSRSLEPASKGELCIIAIAIDLKISDLLSPKLWETAEQLLSISETSPVHLCQCGESPIHNFRIAAESQSNHRRHMVRARKLEHAPSELHAPLPKSLYASSFRETWRKCLNREQTERTENVDTKNFQERDQCKQLGFEVLHFWQNFSNKKAVYFIRVSIQHLRKDWKGVRHFSSPVADWKHQKNRV